MKYSTLKHIVLGMLCTACIAFVQGDAHAQVPGVVTQYMHNALPLNPAFAGSAGHFTSAASYRAQWAGFDGAPTTNVFSLHTPVKNENIGIGIVGWFDRFGVSKQSSVQVVGAYRLRFRNNNLFLGVSGGMRQGQNNWQDVVTNEVGDELFASYGGTSLTPELGTGAYFQAKNYYVSLSSPILLDVKYNGGDQYAAVFNPKTVPVYLNVGGEVSLSPAVALRPSAMITKDRIGDVTADVNLMACFKDLLQLGGSWRSNRSAVILMKYQFLPQLSFAYAFDHAFSELGNYAGGSHELTLQFDLTSKLNTLNTRFF